MTTEPFIGIDFGTTTSAVSWWNPRTQAPEIIRNEQDDEKTPSIIYWGKDEILIGKPAADQLADVPNMPPDEQDEVLGRTFASVKRLLGENLRFRLNNVL